MEPVRFTAFKFPENDVFQKYSFVDEENNIGDTVISGLFTVNIFIGSNDSGKSRLLRSIFFLQDEQTSYLTNLYAARKYLESLSQIWQRPEKEISNTDPSRMRANPSVQDFENLVTHFELNLVDKFISEYKENNSEFINMYSSCYRVTKKIFQGFKQGIKIEGGKCIVVRKDGGTFTQDNSTFLTLTNKYIRIMDYLLETDSSIFLNENYLYESKGNKIYLPILQGLRNFSEEQVDLYRERTINDYFSLRNNFDNQQVYIGLELYQDLKEKLLGDPEDRDLVKEFENLLSSKFFKNQTVTLIPKDKGDEPKIINIKIGDEPQFPIYQLGDGLLNLIICTYKIFTEKERHLFFIEEPDLYMHPSMQRAFLEVLCEHDHHQYFLTSHSNHLLDMTLDFDKISVYHFSKRVEAGQPYFTVKLTSSGDHRLLLDLGVRNSSVFLSNSTIWVDGISDRFYLRSYMKKYLAELKQENEAEYQKLSIFREDLHYSFVEYQGSTLTHWNFSDDDDLEKIKASLLCASAFLIADGDIKSQSKGGRAEIYREMLVDKFYSLPCKEIENLIPVEILREVPFIKKAFSAKSEALKNIQYEAYMAEDGLGQYLDNLLGEEGKFAASSGTIKQKDKLFRESCKLMDSSDIGWQLSEELKQLCTRIFEHISDKN